MYVCAFSSGQGRTLERHLATSDQELPSLCQGLRRDWGLAPEAWMASPLFPCRSQHFLSTCWGPGAGGIVSLNFHKLPFHGSHYRLRTEVWGWWCGGWPAHGHSPDKYTFPKSLPTGDLSLVCMKSRASPLLVVICFFLVKWPQHSSMFYWLEFIHSFPVLVKLCKQVMANQKA